MQIKLVTDYLDISAERYPDKIAFSDNKQEITFSELQVQAYHIAESLIHKDFFKQPVAIYLDKSVQCVAAFMGAAYSGNFYTPIDTKMPDNRIEKILETLQPKAIITDRKHYEKIKKVYAQAEIIIYEEALNKKVDKNLIYDTTSKVIDTDVLYVLFTSGSTGIPKGVIITHRSVVDYIEWATERFNIHDDIIIGNQAPFYFDNSTLDIYLTMKNAGTMYIIPQMYFAFPAKLMQYLNEKCINMIFWVPAELIIVANLGVVEKLHVDSLNRIYFAGEVMPNKQLNMWRKEYPDAQFVNLYGPTEITVDCTYYIVDRAFNDDEPLPIGVPCRNSDVLVLSDNDELVKGNEIGELCVRGTSLALGYYNNPQKTAEAFTQNPLNDKYPERIYRTGDLVHYNERGEIMYDSRKDFQIKHLGHRIELGEIETAASAIEGVDQNCCLYDGKKSAIILFYTGKANEETVRNGLKEQVTDYMMPGRYIQLRRMPLNMNGKIDRVELKKQLEE